MNRSDNLYFKQPILTVGYNSRQPINTISPQNIQLYYPKHKMYLSPDTKRPSTFVKNTNRRYFGAQPPNPHPQMKSSSILFNYTPKENPNRLLGAKSPSIRRNQPTENIPLMSASYIDKRQKPIGMSSSMIVGKTNQHTRPSALASGDKIKELHDWADELKKKLLPFIEQQNNTKKNKEELLNKYAPSPSLSVQLPKQENTSQNTPVNAFSKNKCNSDSDYYSKDFTDYSKFNGFFKQKSKESDLTNLSTHPQYTRTQSYESPPSDYHSYTSSPFKKPQYPTDYSSSLYSTSSSYSPAPPTSYPTYSQPHYLPPKPPKKKALGKQDFEIGKKLGNGMFGQVFLVRHKVLKFVCAMKILKKSVVRQQKVEDQLVRQIKIQFYLRHQNVINLYGFFSDSESVYLLLELCMDGHLFNMLKQKQRFQDVQAADIIKQVCTGLDYIHRQRIIHRDIKPQNIIMHMGVAKICDFGWAVYRGYGLRNTFCGTPLYTPPQLLRGQMYDQKFDIWAIGILAYQLIVGRFPFRIFCEDDLNRILTDQITFPFSVDVSPDAKNFILSIIRKDPRDRIQIDQILSHPFLRKNYKHQITIDFKP